MYCPRNSEHAGRKTTDPPLATAALCYGKAAGLRRASLDTGQKGSSLPTRRLVCVKPWRGRRGQQIPLLCIT